MVGLRENGQEKDLFVVGVGDLEFSLVVESDELLFDDTVDSHADEFHEWLWSGSEVLEVVIQE